MSQLDTPTITAQSDGTTILLAGLSDPDASGWKVRLGTIPGRGLESAARPDAGGAVTLQDNRPRLTYYVQVQALGDGTEFTDSDWSDTVAAVTGGEEDASIPVPTLGEAQVSFTSAAFAGLRTDLGIRVGVGDGDDDADSPPRMGGTDADGNLKILGLEPGKSYDVRVCYVRGQKCGAWSDAARVVTEAVTAEAVVTTNASTGTGSLTAVIAAAQSGTRISFDSSMAGQTITLATVCNCAGKKLYIDGTGLAEKVILGGYGFSNADNVHVVGLRCALSAYLRGNYIDCDITSAAFAWATSLCRCALTGVASAKIMIPGSWHDSVWCDACAPTTGLADSCAAVNCYFMGQASRYVGSAAQLSGCVIANNTIGNNGIFIGSGRMVETDIVGNTLTHASYRIVGASDLYGCRISGNTCACANAPAYSGTADNVCVDSIFAGNVGGTTDEVGTGVFTRCVIEGAGDRAVTSGSPVFRDCLILGSAAGSAVNCTADRFAGTADNCLLGPNSSAAGSANLYWNEEDSTSPLYIDKVFRAPAAGDWHLAANSPAVDAGDDTFVEEGELDLDGNPRVMLDHVDVGCYETVIYRLDPPTFFVSVAPGGQGTVLFGLPSGAAAFDLQYDDNDGFTNPREISSASAGIALTGLEGNVYFRAKSVGIEGQTLDSDWSETKTAYFDAVAPVVIIDEAPIEITVGDTFDPLAEVVVTDDSGAECDVHYCVYQNDVPVEVDGQTIDQRISGLSAGVYSLVITAADPTGNVGSAWRELDVLLPKLPTPAIDAEADGTTVILSGFIGEHAAGWKVNLNGEISDVTPDADGRVVYEHLRTNVAYTFRAQAVAGDGWRDSDWSEAVTVTLEGDPLTNILEAAAAEINRILPEADAAVDFFPRSDAAAADTLAVTVTPREISNSLAARGVISSELVVDISFAQKIASEDDIAPLSKKVEKVFAAMAYQRLADFPDANCVEAERGLFNYDIALAQRVFAATVSLTYSFHYRREHI